MRAHEDKREMRKTSKVSKASNWESKAKETLLTSADVSSLDGNVQRSTFDPLRKLEEPSIS
jgi:hypothetical protein